MPLTQGAEPRKERWSMVHTAYALTTTQHVLSTRGERVRRAMMR